MHSYLNKLLKQNYYAIKKYDIKNRAEYESARACECLFSVFILVGGPITNMNGLC